MLSARLTNPRSTLGAIAVLLSMLTDDDLSRLIQKSSLERFRGSVLSLVIAEAFSRKTVSQQEGVARKLSNALSALRACPGEPRITYLQFIDPKPENFTQLLLATLTDEAIDDVMLLPLLYQFGQTHSDVIDESLNSVSAERRELITRFQNRRRSNE